MSIESLVRRSLNAGRRRTQRRLDRDLRNAVVNSLSDGAGSIAIIEPRLNNSVVAKLRQEFPRAAVLEFTETGSARHVRLTALGPFDVIVDARSSRKRAQRFLDVFYQLSDGGTLVVLDGAAELPSREPGGVGALLAAAQAAKGKPCDPRGQGIPAAVIDAQWLSTVLGEATSHGSHLAVSRSGAPTLAKLREHEMNAYLAARPQERDRVLETIPAAPFRSRCELRENVEVPRSGFPDTYETIDLSLRVYHDVVITPLQLLSTDRVITPDSYRHNQQRRLRNRATVELAPRFARLNHSAEDLPFLEGTFYYLDNEVRGHFGHLVTEQVSRFWGWTRAKELYPDAKAVVTSNAKRPELSSWESQMYAAGGIPPEEVLLLYRPVRAERVVSATPMLSNPVYVHPRIVPVWRAVGDRLAASTPEFASAERIFCSRRLAKRACLNPGEVERVFADHGFTIIFPEDYSLGEQVRIFRNASVIAGFAGSGLFNLCFVEDAKRVIMIGSTAYNPRNEYLIASLLGHRIDSVTCVPDDPTDLQSTYRYDADREGAFLADALASL